MISRIFYSFLLLSLFLAEAAFSQVYIDNTILFVSPDSSKRQILRLSLPGDTADIVSTSASRETPIIYSSATGTGAYALSLSPPLQKYSPGVMIYFKASQANAGPVTLNVNGLGDRKLLSEGKDLKAGEISAGEIIGVIFDSTDFRMLSRNDLVCPAGFVEANDRYCIEVNERPVKTYYQANNDCLLMGARLCTWEEWYYACQKTTLALANATNNYEWVDDTANHSHTMYTVGSGSCTAANSISPGGTYSYRCCYQK